MTRHNSKQLATTRKNPSQPVTTRYNSLQLVTTRHNPSHPVKSCQSRPYSSHSKSCSHSLILAQTILPSAVLIHPCRSKRPAPSHMSTLHRIHQVENFTFDPHPTLVQIRPNWSPTFSPNSTPPSQKSLCSPNLSQLVASRANPFPTPPEPHL